MKSKVLSALLAVIMVSVMFVSPAFAYATVQGSVIDSLNLDPWSYGGEVWVYNPSTGDVCGTGVLSASGTFTIALNGSQDDLGYGGLVNCRVGMNGQALEILIDFTCGMSVATCSAPYGSPATATRQFTQNGLPIAYNAGYIETGTGPTAIQLQGFGGGNTMTVTVAAGATALLLAGVTFMALRRRKVA